jgi:hypothetical protein
MEIIPRYVIRASHCDNKYDNCCSISTHLDIRNSDGSLMVFIDRIRDMLEHNLLASMENLILLHDREDNDDDDDDDEEEEGQNRFSALHLSWYNCHCTQVC